MKRLVIILFAVIFIWSSFDSDYLESFTPLPNPQYTIVISSPTAADDFLFTKVGKNIFVSEIEAFLQTGTSATISIDKCNSVGSSCSAVEASIVCSGGTPTTVSYSSIDSPTVNANQTLKFKTDSVSSPGYLMVIIQYKVLE